MAVKMDKARKRMEISCKASSTVSGNGIVNRQAYVMLEKSLQIFGIFFVVEKSKNFHKRSEFGEIFAKKSNSEVSTNFVCEKFTKFFKQKMGANMCNTCISINGMR